MRLTKRSPHEAFHEGELILNSVLRHYLPIALAVGCLVGRSATALGGADSDSDTALQPTASQGTLPEVTVTATRRSETLQHVPYNISSVSSGELAQSGVSSLNDFARMMPGLQNVDTGPNPRGSGNQFSMRGLRTDSAGNEQDIFPTSTVAPVSIYLGETPIFFPLALRDLERVEVLKGPQGTLYGSGSLAGTVRLIPHRAEFDKYEGSVDLEGSGTQYSGKISGSGNAFFNAPLADNLAFRVAGGYQLLGGFIDAVDLIQRSKPGDEASAPTLRVPSDPRSGYLLAPIAHDTNSSEQWYLRPVLRWKYAELLDAELSYTHQRVEVADAQYQNGSYSGGAFNFDSFSGDPNGLNTYRPGGPYKHTAGILSPAQSSLDLAALVLSVDLSFASVTSSSSAYRRISREAADFVPALEIYGPDGKVSLNYYDYFSSYPRANGQLHIEQRDKAFVQELRLVSTWDKRIDYIIGAYFQLERFNFQSVTTEPGYTQYLTAINGPGLPRPLGDLMYIYPMDQNGYRFDDTAVFGELTWHITPQWQITGGVRFFHQDFTSQGHTLNYDFSGTPTVDLDVDNRSVVNDHILKFNTSYDLSPHLKIYGTYSEGFRRGGTNTLPATGPYATRQELLSYQPDKSKNHEIGLKGELFDRRERFTIDAFLVLLDKFQFNSFSGSAFGAVFNGSEAKSKGAEAETEFQLTRDLAFGLSYSYTQAKVSRGFTIFDYPALGAPQLIPVATIAENARLPGTPENSANAMLNYTIHVGSTNLLLLHADLAYRDSAPAYIDPASARYWIMPSSILLNTQLTYASGERWATDVFIHNLTNETVYSGGFGTGQSAPNLFQMRYVGRPRTYGLGLHYNW